MALYTFTCTNPDCTTSSFDAHVPVERRDERIPCPACDDAAVRRRYYTPAIRIDPMIGKAFGFD